jgi:hypothetical protein
MLGEAELTKEEPVERWRLFLDELALVEGKTGYTKLGFVVLLNYEESAGSNGTQSGRPRACIWDRVITVTLCWDPELHGRHGCTVHRVSRTNPRMARASSRGWSSGMSV